ncbi:type 1 glutamine amidotransferase [Peribacillus deserti]|uniref:Amidotransferase n=1 Tax=Peribacillus deserti TaxID=673318 RepID=A0A2N5M534_9BACI|nr:type 1 glutamine amidotransferase [Peribacillus deserti]PLT29383.1 amidotransferase [Peribacillus deserti]
MKIHYIQNDELAALGHIEEWAAEKNYPLACTKMYENQALPDIESFDMLIILGGRMGAYEEAAFPWLAVEKEFMKKAIKGKKMVLGICLGAQLLAEVLGGRVYPHEHQEMGWWPIQVSARSTFFEGVPDQFPAFEHHGDTFDLPQDATLLASSTGCTNQAFSYGENVVGIQFHPEFSEDIICELAVNERPSSSGEYIQAPDSWTGRQDLLIGAKRVLFTLLNNMEANLSR